MKSFALILWLILADGRQEVVLTDHLDSNEHCQTAAKTWVAKYAAQGKKVRYLCHEVVPEVGDVDENGNPI